MAVINFEQAIPVPSTIFDINANVVMTEGPSTVPPGAIITTPPTAIQVDQPTIFTFNWAATGWLAATILAPSPIKNWKFDVFYELMGPGEATFAVPTSTVPTSLSGFTTLTVLPGTVATEGIYRVVVRMMMTLTGNPSPICGFIDFGLVEYYKG